MRRTIASLIAAALAMERVVQCVAVTGLPCGVMSTIAAIRSDVSGERAGGWHRAATDPGDSLSLLPEADSHPTQNQGSATPARFDAIDEHQHNPCAQRGLLPRPPIGDQRRQLWSCQWALAVGQVRTQFHLILRVFPSAPWQPPTA